MVLEEKNVREVWVLCLWTFDWLATPIRARLFERTRVSMEDVVFPGRLALAFAPLPQTAKRRS